MGAAHKAMILVLKSIRNQADSALKKIEDDICLTESLKLFGEGRVSLVAAPGKARHIAMNCLACRSGVQFPFL